MKGGYRPGAGRPKGSKNKNRTKSAEKSGNRSEIRGKNLTPLEYMLRVMRDPREPMELRCRMAIAAAPFCHPRKGEVGSGKKEAAGEKAKIAGLGKFRASASPQIKLVK